MELIDRYRVAPGLQESDGWRYIARDKGNGHKPWLFTHKPERVDGVRGGITWKCSEGRFARCPWLPAGGKLKPGQCMEIDFTIDQRWKAAREQRARNAILDAEYGLRSFDATDGAECQSFGGGAVNMFESTKSTVYRRRSRSSNGPKF